MIKKNKISILIVYVLTLELKKWCNTEALLPEEEKNPAIKSNTLKGYFWVKIIVKLQT